MDLVLTMTGEQRFSVPIKALHSLLFLPTAAVSLGSVA